MPTLELRRIAMSDRERLRASAERYWKELMPHAQVIQDPARRANLFADQFRFDDPRILLWWVMSNNAEIGFTRLSLWQNHDGSGATINDFFIEAPHRRQGHDRPLLARSLTNFECKEFTASISMCGPTTRSH